MADKLPIVCIFGASGIELRSAADAPASETTELECHCYPSDAALDEVIIRHRPHVIVSIGRLEDFPALMRAPFDLRRRWLHYADAEDRARIGRDSFNCYLAMCLDRRDEEPLVSVFTPAYRTGERFLRPLRSLKAQSYTNWEWVILDDSGDGGATAQMIARHAGGDHRIRLLQPGRHSGVIGEVKYECCMATRGEILVELDHDDELTPDALAHVVAGWRKYPECGFYYTDFAEVDARLSPLRYGEGWAHGYGSYRTEYHRDRPLAVVNAPNVNAKTIRGLVAAPNHLRAWRRDVYMAVGGHNRMLHVADDMELMIRTFLATRMLRIPKFCYVQYHDGTNTQTVRNKDIQRHVRYLRWKYDERIHRRFLDLGVDDWVWNAAGGYSDLAVPNPIVEPVASVLAELG